MYPVNVSVNYYFCVNHARLRIDDSTYSVGKYKVGGVNQDDYEKAVVHARTEGCPVIEFQLQVDPKAAGLMADSLQKMAKATKDAYESGSSKSAMQSLDERYGTSKMTCMSFVANQLETHAHISLPYPASLSPHTGALCLFGKYLVGQLPCSKKEVSGITMIGTFKPTAGRVFSIVFSAGLEAALLLPPSVITTFYKKSGAEKIVKTTTSTVETIGFAALSVSRIFIGH